MSSTEPEAQTEEVEIGSKVPRDCGMPSLHHLEEGTGTNQFLNLAFRGAGPSDPKASALWRYYSRRVDAMLCEYNHARELLQAFVDGGNNAFICLFRCSEHLEACLTNMVRAIHLAQRMRKHRPSPNMPKRVDALNDSKNKVVRDIRNAIEHAENSEIGEGEAVILRPYSDGLELGSHRVRYDKLAQFIEELYGIASSLEDHRDEVEDNT